MSRHSQLLDFSNCEEKEYVIVEFPNETHDETGIPMALISSTWIFVDDGNLLCCYWPLYLKSTSQRQKAVINHVQVIIEKSQICPIVVKYSTDDYNKACIKLRKLEMDSSESQSSDSFERPKKDNRDTDFIYMDNRDDTDDDDNGPPSPPHLKILSDIAPETINVMTPKKTYTILKTIPSEKNLKMNKFHNLGLSSSKHSSNYKSQEFYVHETQKRPDKTHKSDVKKSIPGNSQSSHVENIGNDNEKTDATICKNFRRNSHVLKTLVQDIQTLEEDMKHLLRLNGEKENFEIEKGLVSFSSHEQLIEFNENLKSGEFFKKSLKYGLVGGRECGNTTRRILSLMIGHELSLNMNWSGRNNKSGFDSLHKIVDLVYESVRRNVLTKNATNADIRTGIKKLV